MYHSGDEIVTAIMGNNNRRHLSIDDELNDVEIVHRVVEMRAKELYAQ